VRGKFVPLGQISRSATLNTLVLSFSTTTTMSTRLLPNYLRSHRKRLGLSQDELAFLLGSQSGAKVSRYESFTRVPSLETALALEIILKKPARELFGGLCRDLEVKVARRAALLEAQKKSRKPKQSATGTPSIINR